MNMPVIRVRRRNHLYDFVPSVNELTPARQMGLGRTQWWLWQGNTFVSRFRAGAMFETVQTNHVMTITMRGDRANAMSLEFCQQLGDALQQAVDGEARAVVIAGNGRVFSAGVDLVRLVDEGAEYLDVFLPELVSLFLKAFTFPKPLVAAVDGHAVAGGCVLACACDYRVISNQARIGVPELRVGVPFPAAGLEIMRWSAAPQSFRQMINIGATFTGPDAVAAGLADDAVDAEHVLPSAIAAAEQLCLVPRDVFHLTKQHLRMPVIRLIEQGDQMHGDEINRLWRSESTRQAVEQYVAERLNK